jgi:hypothetical protein
MRRRGINPALRAALFRVQCAMCHERQVMEKGWNGIILPSQPNQLNKPTPTLAN